jgi:hypothetical protein
MRKYGCASQPLDAAHCQPPLLAERSKSLEYTLSPFYFTSILDGKPSGFGCPMEIKKVTHKVTFLWINNKN